MNCPICLKEINPKLIETHTDSISNWEYKIYSCPQCKVVFSDPMKLPVTDWYYKAFPYREVEKPDKTRWWCKSFLNEKIQHGGKLLDVGCGFGNFLLLAQVVGYKVTGIDLDERVIKKAKKLGLEDIEAITFEKFFEKRGNEKFNVITLFGILEHMEKPNIFIDQIKQLLYPNGYVAIVVPNNNRSLTFVRELHDYPPHHFTRWTARQLSSFLENKNFKIISINDKILSLKSIKINLYSLLLRTISKFINLFSPTSSKFNLTNKKLNFIKIYYNILKNIYLTVITPIALIFWIYFKLKNPKCGSDIYLRTIEFQ